MKITKRIIAVAGACALASVVGAPAAIADKGTASDDVVTLDLYNLTDIHGHIEPVFDKYSSEAGLSHMSCYVKKAREQNPNSQLTLLGDNFGASPFTSGSQDDNPTVEALNKMNVFASTIGNHEFDQGLKVLQSRIKGDNPSRYTKIDFPYLAANIKGMGDYLGDYRMWASPSGVKVAFIGAIADDVPTKLFPGTVDSLTFEKPVPVINDLAKKLKTEGGFVTQANGTLGAEKVKADVVIAMFDNDVEQSYPKMGKYVDGLMGGDTHKPYYFTKVQGAEGNILSATASGSYTDNLSNLQIKFNTKTRQVVDSRAIQIPANEVKKCGDDRAVKAVIEKAQVASDSTKNRVITDKAGKFYRGIQETVRDGKVTPGDNRGIESTIGGLVGDVMKNSFTDLDNHRIDIGVVVAGDLRHDLATDTGKITVGDIFKVMPWSNQIAYVKMTGAQFKVLLEQQWKELGENSTRPMLKLNFSSNVRYTFDPQRKRGDRVTSILIDNKPIDMKKLYTVAGSDFLMGGGDSFTLLQDSSIADTLRKVPNKLDREWFESYLKAHPNVQPRVHKSSVGVSVMESELVGDDVKVKVSLRGLSFSKGAPLVEKVRVKLGGVSQEATVNNTLQDPNASNYDAIVTTDGVGYTDAPVELQVPGVCKGKADQDVRIPLTVADQTGFELVSAAHNLGVDVKCPGVADSQGGNYSFPSISFGGSVDKPKPDDAKKPGDKKQPGDKKDKKPGANKPVVSKFDKQFTKKVELPKDAVKRASGSDRVATSVSALGLAKNHEVVVLATGSNFPDALVGGALAGAYKGGVVLTTGSTLEQSILDSLKSYKTKTVHIVGGTGAVSAAKEAQLKNAGLEVIRHAGVDRYATAAAVKAATLNALGGKSAIACNATGGDFPDALACSSAASQMGGTVDLVKPGAVVAKDATAKTVCAGGPACRTAGVGVEKVVGSDRFETAYMLAGVTPAKGAVLVSNGQSYADSLVAGALAGSLNADLVLAKPTRVNVPADTKTMQLFGGKAVLPENMAVYTK